MGFFLSDNKKDDKEKGTSSVLGFSRKKPGDKNYYDKRKDEIDNLRDYHDSLKKEEKEKETEIEEEEKKERTNYSNVDHPFASEMDNIRQKLTPQKEEALERTTADLPRHGFSSVLRTNLIKNEVAIYVDWKKNIVIILLAVCVYLVVLLASLYVVKVEERRIMTESDKLDQEIMQLNIKLAKAKKDINEADVFRRKIGIVDHYLDSHIYWTEFFNEIEEYTLEDVSFGRVISFSGELGGKLAYKAKTNSYENIVNQLRLYRTSEYVKSANSYAGNVSQSADEDGVSSFVSFEVALDIDDKVFLKKDEEFIEE